MQEQPLKTKKTRAPRSEASKQAQREKMLARAARLREENGGVAATAETRAAISERKTGKVYGPVDPKKLKARNQKRLNSSKAKDFVPFLFSFILELSQAAQNEEVFDMMVQAYPEMKIQRSSVVDGAIVFSKAVKSIRDEHGVVAERIWKKLFVCIQSGGWSTTEEHGYPSVWSLNREALTLFVMARMARQSRTGEPFTVAQALEVLQDFEHLKRVPTKFSEGTVKTVAQGLQLIVVASDKKIKNETQRAELKLVRAKAQAKVDEKNSVS